MDVLLTRGFDDGSGGIQRNRGGGLLLELWAAGLEGRRGQMGEMPEGVLGSGPVLQGLGEAGELALGRIHAPVQVGEHL